MVELMISLTIGLLVSAALVQIMLGNNMTERLNQGVASVQESGRFIIGRLRSDLLMTGRYDSLSPNLNRDVDVAIEGSFVQNHPIPLLGDFSSDATIGAKEGPDGTNDTLVISAQVLTDCRGYKLGYAPNEEFYVVNQYFISGNKLQCRGFDGRVLQGLKNPVANDGDNAYVLLDDVYSFQVQYGVTNVLSTQDNSSRPVRFITADALSLLRVEGAQVVAIRIAVLLKANSEVFIENVPSFKLLDESAIQPHEKRLFKQFETTITLRNVKNFIRSRNI